MTGWKQPPALVAAENLIARYCEDTNKNKSKYM